MKRYYAYIRVSTVRQGEKGSSLHEQKDAITTFASRHGLSICSWFEEMETAAKLGRKQFSQMLSLLLKGKAQGVIFHKIDRGARNLKDWAAIQGLIDGGVDVRFAHESLDMNSRGGRLTADLLAVIAADYVRNLRDEIRKGIRGRLKQGLYPLPAPIGYLDTGTGRPKDIDPVRAPLIQRAFERYASGSVSLHALADEMFLLGLRNRSGQKVPASRLAQILGQTFYIGLISMNQTGETYQGAHAPIIPKSLFDQVQAVRSGKANCKIIKHSFLFRRMIQCGFCNRKLVGEIQKGHVYYRCHTKNCPTKGIREDTIDAIVLKAFDGLIFNEDMLDELRSEAVALKADWQNWRQKELKSVSLTKSSIDTRLSRLIDAYLNGDLEKDLFEEKKRALLLDRQSQTEKFVNLGRTDGAIADKVSRFIELSQSLSLSYKTAKLHEKREMVRATTSNFVARRKNVVVELQSPFRDLAKCRDPSDGGPYRSIPRTGVTCLLNQLAEHFASGDRVFKRFVKSMAQVNQEGD